MANLRLNRVLLAVLVVWVLFGSWSLFRTDGGEVPGLEPIVGHVVVFFFVALAFLVLGVQLLGLQRGLGLGIAGIVAVAGISELLQPILTDTRQAQGSDLAGNLLGIGAASIVALISVRLVHDPSRRACWTAGFCALGLVGSVGVTAIGLDEVQVAITCRDSGYDHIEGIDGGPIIAVEGQMVRLGSAEPTPLVDGLVSEDSVGLRCSLTGGNGYTLVATVVPDSIGSSGPTRIFTSSVGTDFSEINTHIGQELDQLSVRVLTGAGLEWELVPGVFAAGRRVTVAVTVTDGEVAVFVDGELRSTFELSVPDFQDWEASFPVLVGDEFTRDRTFEGNIERVLVFDRALPAGDPMLE